MILLQSRYWTNSQIVGDTNKSLFAAVAELYMKVKVTSATSNNVNLTVN
jgi:hypothetical protein